MTKKEYLDKLTRELGSMSYNDVKEILGDIENHFDESALAGKTEEEAAAMLGDPSELAADYKDGMTFPTIMRKKEQKAANKPAVQEPTSSTVAFVILITIFVAIPAWVTLLGIVLSIIAIELGIVAGAIALLCTCWTFGPFLTSGLLCGLTLLFFGIFGYAVTFFSIKYFIVGTKWYIDSMKKIWKNGI